MSEDKNTIEQENLNTEETEASAVVATDDQAVEKEEIVAEVTEEVAVEEHEAAEEETLTHVFSGDVEGEVYTFDQLDTPSDEYTADEYNQLIGMYENTLNTIEEKEIVTGRIVSIDEKYVVIDIGFKSEGIIAVNEFSNKSLENMAPGDEVEVFLDQ